MKQVLLLDNYDSFTYNLAHYIEALGFHVDVIRNDVEIDDLTVYSHCILSPGPGLPSEANYMLEIIEELDSKVPVLGVCLGMQAIAEYLNGELYNQSEVKHGVSEKINITDSVLFKGLSKTIEVGLYHSWAVDENGDFEVTAKSEYKVVMAIENVGRKMYGVQFHPESVMTIEGKRILQNFLNAQ